MKAIVSSRFLFASVVLSGLLMVPAEAANPVVLHVAPDGNDAWQGKLEKPNREKTDGPLTSLTGARDVVRRLRERGLTNAPVSIRFATGTYPLFAPVEFLPDHI